VAVTTNTSVLVTAGSTAHVTRLLALEHLAVCRDAMTLALRNLRVCGWLALGWGPGEVVTADLDVVISKLAELVVVHTEEFGLFGCAEVESWDLVDSVGEDCRYDKCPSTSSDDVSELNVELLPVVLDPTSVVKTSVDTVETDDVGSTKDGVEEKTDDTGHAVLSEHIHSVVNADPVLD